MNLAVRGIDADIRWNNDGSFHRDELQGPDGRLHPRQSALQRFRLGRRPAARGCALEIRHAAGGNANYAWLQHIFHHLAPNGTAGVVLANGSMSSTQSGEGDIRQGDDRGRRGRLHGRAAGPAFLFDADSGLPLVLRPQQERLAMDWRDRRGEVLFIDARKLGHMVDRTRKEFSDGDIDEIADIYHAWRGEPGRRSLRGRARDSARRRPLRRSGTRPRPDAGPLCRRGGCRGGRCAVRRALCGAEGDAGRAVRRG